MGRWMKSGYHGFSLIDAMLLTLGATLITTATISIFSVNQKADQAGDNSQKLVELIEANIVEINTRPYDQMPSVDTCRVRYYDEKLKFINESTVGIGSTGCIDRASRGYKVVWKAAEPTNFTFSHPDFLKIPKLTGGIRQIQVVGSMKLPEFEKTLSLTLLKEKK